MPSAFSHAFSAIALGSAFKKPKNNYRILITGAICSAIPDADVLSFHFGIPYASMWGHRGITHSFFFAFVVALIVAPLFFSQDKNITNRLRLFLYFFISTALHPFLDAFTDGGLGVAFFAPFNNERYFFPFRPIEVSPLSISRFFTQRGIEIIKNEFMWIWIPSIAFIFICRLFKKKCRTINQLFVF